MLDVGRKIETSFWQWLYTRASYVMNSQGLKQLCIEEKLLTFISREQAEVMLENQPHGTAVARFANFPQNSKDLIAISVVVNQHNQKITHILFEDEPALHCPLHLLLQESFFNIVTTFMHPISKACISKQELINKYSPLQPLPQRYYQPLSSKNSPPHVYLPHINPRKRTAETLNGSISSPSGPDFKKLKTDNIVVVQHKSKIGRKRIRYSATSTLRDFLAICNNTFGTLNGKLYDQAMNEFTDMEDIKAHDDFVFLVTPTELNS